jgi:hypothetical protein
MKGHDMRRLFVIPLLVIAAHAQQDLRTYYQNLPNAPIGMEAFDEAVKVAARLETLPKAQVAALLPLIFKAAMHPDDGFKHGAVGLFSVAKRRDSGELLKPHMQDIAKLFDHPNPARKASAAQILMTMYPTPPEAADILLAFLNRPKDPKNPTALNEKIDALAVLTRLQNPPKEQTDLAAMQILSDPSLAHRMGAAINASIYRDSSDRVLDIVAQQLDKPDQELQLVALYALRTFPQAVARHRSKIAKIADDPKSSDKVRTFAQDTLDNKKR